MLYLVKSHSPNAHIKPAANYTKFKSVNSGRYSSANRYKHNLIVFIQSGN